MRKLLMAALTACIGLFCQGYAQYAGYADSCNPCGGSYYGDNCCGCNSFGGVYFGANVGYAFHDHTWVDRDAWVDNFSTDWAVGSVVTVNNGGTVGFQAGYNWLCNCALFGFEADANWAHLKRSKRFSPSPDDSGNFTRLRLQHHGNWFGTIRARAGVVVNDLLLFATFGAAWAHVKHNWAVNDFNGGTIFLNEGFRSHRARWGMSVGFGAEWLVCQNWSLKAEALYLKFPQHTVSGRSVAGNQTVHFDLSDSIWVARVGVNYNLSGLFSCCGGCW